MRKIIVGLFVISLGGAVWFGIVAPLAATDPLEAQIRRWHFLPVEPPGQIDPPGTLYAVDYDGTLRDPLCRAEWADWKSALVQIELPEITNEGREHSTFKADASLMKRLNSALHTNNVRSFELEMHGAEELYYTNASLISIADTLMTIGSCSAAVKRELKSGKLVCQLRSLLKATVRYKLNLDSDLLADAKAVEEVRDAVASTLPDNISSHVQIAEISGSTSGTRNTSDVVLTTGDNLFYGVQVKALCLTSPSDDREIDYPDNLLKIISLHYDRLYGRIFGSNLAVAKEKS